MPNQTMITMKTTRYHIAKILGVVALGGLLLHPIRLAAQENDNRQRPSREREGGDRQAQPREREGANAAPQVERIQPMIGEIDQLLRAGKFDEILQQVERFRNVAKDNPQVMAMIQRVLGEQKSNPGTAPQRAAGPDIANQAPMLGWPNTAGVGAPAQPPMVGRRGFEGPGAADQAPMSRW